MSEGLKGLYDDLTNSLEYRLYVDSVLKRKKNPITKDYFSPKEYESLKRVIGRRFDSDNEFANLLNRKFKVSKDAKYIPIHQNFRSGGFDPKNQIYFGNALGVSTLRVPHKDSYEDAKMEVYDKYDFNIYHGGRGYLQSAKRLLDNVKKGDFYHAQGPILQIAERYGAQVLPDDATAKKRGVEPKFVPVNIEIPISEIMTKDDWNTFKSQIEYKATGGKMDIKQQTQNVAAQGRFGDSMLLHVNPAEVKGLASAMPITVNPETGQPEAFLPFLAPIAGSLLGSSLLAGIGGMSALTAGALGSGLAQYAATGDLKKGLLAGLTGYGLGTAMQGAGAAKAGADATAAATQTATDAATQNLLSTPGMTDVIGTGGATAGQQVLNEAGQLALQGNIATAQPAIAQAGKSAVEGYAGTGAGAVKDAFTGNTIGEGFGNLATGLTDPMAYIPAGIGMGGTSIMESQEAFERMIGESEEAYRKRREDMYRNNPEPILYSAEGGRTGYYEGGRFGEIPDNITGGNLPQIFAPARQVYDVNPDFMAGFAPETMYFNPATISAPASGLQAGAPPIGIDTYQGSKGGYGGRQASIAPQTSIDPYTAYTGSAPKGLEFTEAPMPTSPETLPIMPITPPDFGIGVPDIGRIDIPNIGNIDIQSIIDGLGDYNRPERFMPMTGEDLGITAPPIMQANTNPVLEMPPVVSLEKLQELPNIPVINTPTIAPFAPTIAPVMPTIEQFTLPDFNTSVASIESIAPIAPVVPTLENITAPSLNIPVMQEMMPTNLGMIPPPINNLESLETQRIGRPSFRDTIRGRAEGGDTLKPIPEDNKGLPNLPKDVRNEMGYMQEGGMTDIQNDPLTQEVTMFILGETDNEQALNDFITKYGSDTFMQLREAVLQSIVPNAQTEGLIRGDGEGGMDDDLRGMIGGKERIAVSQDEFIVPADVVSMLGDGSSDAGSKELYDMMDRVRKEKTGTTKQAPKLANAGGLLPA